jgi:hypothetical protein
MVICGPIVSHEASISSASLVNGATVAKNTVSTNPSVTTPRAMPTMPETSVAGRVPCAFMIASGFIVYR